MKGRAKNFLENNRWLKTIPNILTVCNSLCGFAAILFTLHVYNNDRLDPAGVLAISAWIILFAMVFDALDGYTARIFNAASMHGLQMDSLSDMVTFGVAPSVLVAIMAHRLRDLKTADFYIVWCLCAFYIGCAAHRLANYNVHAMLEKKDSEKFSGLPSPGAAAGICSLVIYNSISSKELILLLKFIPYYAGILGLLMVSNVRYAHAGKFILSAKKNKPRMFLIVILAIFFAYSPALTTVIFINLYIISGPFTEFLMRRNDRIAASKKLGLDIVIDSES